VRYGASRVSSGGQSVWRCRGASSLSEPQWAAHVRPSPVPDPLLIAELDRGEAAVIALTRICTPCISIIEGACKAVLVP
jgi:hypothetical protein